MSCPDDDTLALLLAGEADDDEALHDHLDRCPRCAAVMVELATLFHDAEPNDDDTPAEGDSIAGRYRLEDALGRGGMGVVFRAHDARLRREVAIKLVRPEVADAHGDELQARLHREARAMARVSDPAVVPVLDVGRHGEMVYVVMELVDGVTLRQWLRARPRSSSEIVRVLAEAGRGLLAAHRAGVVHRDFKPDNVMVGRDGRARVTDFGMAMLTGRASDTQSMQGDGTVEIEPETEDLSTRTGTVMGTPAYMAPEQIDGHETTARSDQYAWCVVLVEALTGQRPFEGRSLLALREAQRHPGRARVERLPARVRAVVRRGLSDDPTLRWPSMEVTLQRLEQPARGAWRLGALAVAGLASLWLVPTAATSSPSMRTRCEAGAEAVASAWAEALASREPSTEPRANDAETPLRAHVEAVREAYDRTCQPRPLPAPTTREQALDCLDAHVARLRPVLDRFRAADDPTVLDALADLRDPSVCFSADARPLPLDPTRAAETRRLRIEMEAAWSLLMLGDEQGAREHLEALQPEIEALGFDSLTAEHGLLLGRVLTREGSFDASLTTLEHAYWLAHHAGDDWVAGRCATGTFRLLGDTLGRFEEADQWARHAESSLRRADDALSWFHFHEAMATVAIRRVDPTTARDHAERSLAVAERLWPPDHRDVITARSNLAVVDLLQGRFAEAEAGLRSTIEAREARYGPDYPDLAVMLHDLAQAVSQQGRPQEAVPLLHRALAITERTHGPQHPIALDARNGLAITAAMQGDYPEAERHFTESLRIIEAEHGPSHERAIRLRSNLGNLQLKQGRLDEAKASLTRALADEEEAVGPDGVGLVSKLVVLARIEHAREQPEAALTHVDRALAILEGRDDVEPDLLAAAQQTRADIVDEP